MQVALYGLECFAIEGVQLKLFLVFEHDQDLVLGVHLASEADRVGVLFQVG